ncbi:alcohol dehydrogenase catalytic domain-containing protein [Pseudonocardia sp. MH-G8]|uniref:alcohol dehydrogenase catalytic domain-containing protein n=1 Tax=Pseudonocardia sp. MH-G8 TaxID=1854588 RepID=UPI000BA0CC14|nr:alcohol dehydrogenase catalytic domain-containing protein [Pseudonocardia sp. MH-G8]OZM77209.1 glutathione-dependent formaldehyde dehydrogenase [Pseudonocardia sp. MH-G8]
MKAVIWQGPGDIAMSEVPDPQVQDGGDAIVRLTMSAICGTDLHMIRGTMPGMRPGTVLGHEGVGVVEEVGGSVRAFRPGDRVVIPSTICCGACSYCRAGYTSQCDVANPNGALAGTAFYGGPEPTGPFDGLQAQFARVPRADANLVPLPDTVSDEQAIILSDVFTTGFYGAQLAEVGPGDTVAVFGCGPVGQLAIASARHLGATRVFAVDGVPGRLEKARRQHVEPVDFTSEDPVAAIRELTGGIGADRVIDAVGVDAYAPPGAGDPERRTEELEEVSGGGDTAWNVGDAPSQASQWAVQAVAKAGTVGIVGVYPQTAASWPIGMAMNRNLTVKMGNCPHRALMPELIDIVAAGQLDPARAITEKEPMTDAVEAYRTFDAHEPGWVKVAVEPAT